jgi:hypothetical protein
MLIDRIAWGFHSWTLFAVLMGLHCVIGMAAAIAAYNQGRPFGPWVFWGLLGGSVALTVVLLTPPKTKLPRQP